MGERKNRDDKSPLEIESKARNLEAILLSVLEKEFGWWNPLIPARKSENGQSKVPNFLFQFYLDVRSFMSVRSGVFEVCD